VQELQEKHTGPADVLHLPNQTLCAVVASNDDAAACVATLQRAAAMVNMLAPQCRRCQQRCWHAAVCARMRSFGGRECLCDAALLRVQSVDARSPKLCLPEIVHLHRRETQSCFKAGTALTDTPCIVCIFRSECATVGRPDRRSTDNGAASEGTADSKNLTSTHDAVGSCTTQTGFHESAANAK